MKKYIVLNVVSCLPQKKKITDWASSAGNIEPEAQNVRSVAVKNGRSREICMSAWNVFIARTKRRQKINK